MKCHDDRNETSSSSPEKPLVHTVRPSKIFFFVRLCQSKTSTDFVNKVSDIHRQITHPSQDVTVEMKAGVSLESFDSVSTETHTETVI